jgi:hypothetical protein
MLNPTDLIAAIRNDRRVGRGTCSTIDECYDDAELVTAFGDEPTIKAAVKAAYRLEGLRMDAMMNARFGDDDDVELKIAAEWKASGRRVLSVDQKAKKAARAKARREARKAAKTIA